MMNLLLNGVKHWLRLPQRQLWYRWVLAAFSAALLIYLGFIKQPVRYGDGYEYLYMSRAVQNHFSPDLRAGDIDSLRAPMTRAGIPVSEKPIGFLPAYSGVLYSYHFWLYSALVAPLMALWDVLFADPIRAFAAFNTLLFLLALWMFDYHADLERRKKILVLGLLAFNPVLWYLSWWSPESFTYSLLLLSLTALTRRRYPLAAALAALAATQNPPLLFVVIFFGCAGLVEIWKRKQWLRLLKFIPAGLIASMPMVFYWVNYGTLNLIMHRGWAKPEFMTLQRVLDLLYDLNVGVLAYLPAVALLFTAVLLSDLIHRRWTRLFFPLVVAVMCLSAGQTFNWNQGMAGVHRFASWMVPWLVFYVFSRPLSRWIQWSAAAGIAVQVFIFFSFGGFLQNVSYTRFTPASQALMNFAPSLYSPDPEIFYERAKDSEGITGSSPTLYISPQGAVKKMWTDLAGLEKLAGLNNLALDIMDVQKYKEAKARLANRQGAQYVNFDQPVIQLKAQPAVTIQGLKYQLVVQNPPPALTPLAANLLLETRITNTGDMPWFHFQDKNPVVLIYQWVSQDAARETFSSSLFWLPMMVMPGETIALPIQVPCPPRPGAYQLELDLMWHNLTFFSQAGNPKPSFSITFIAP